MTTQQRTNQEHQSHQSSTCEKSKERHGKYTYIYVCMYVSTITYFCQPHANYCNEEKKWFWKGGEKKIKKKKLKNKNVLITLDIFLKL